MGDSRKYPYPTMGSINILPPPPLPSEILKNVLLPHAFGIPKSLTSLPFWNLWIFFSPSEFQFAYLKLPMNRTFLLPLLQEKCANNYRSNNPRLMSLWYSVAFRVIINILFCLCAIFKVAYHQMKLLVLLLSASYFQESRSYWYSWQKSNVMVHEQLPAAMLKMTFNE